MVTCYPKDPYGTGTLSMVSVGIPWQSLCFHPKTCPHKSKKVILIFLHLSVALEECRRHHFYLQEAAIWKKLFMMERFSWGPFKESLNVLWVGWAKMQHICGCWCQRLTRSANANPGWEYQPVIFSQLVNHYYSHSETKKWHSIMTYITMLPMWKSQDTPSIQIHHPFKYI